MRLRVVGERIAAAYALSRRLTISGGVPAGASSPYQGATTTDGNPCSAVVGMSGAREIRFGLAMARIRSAPDGACGRSGQERVLAHDRRDVARGERLEEHAEQ